MEKRIMLRFVKELPTIRNYAEIKDRVFKVHKETVAKLLSDPETSFINNIVMYTTLLQKPPIIKILEGNTYVSSSNVEWEAAHHLTEKGIEQLRNKIKMKIEGGDNALTKIPMLITNKIHTERVSGELVTYRGAIVEILFFGPGNKIYASMSILNDFESIINMYIPEERLSKFYSMSSLAAVIAEQAKYWFGAKQEEDCYGE